MRSSLSVILLSSLNDASNQTNGSPGSPVILTLPHFYLGASEFSQYAVGLKADKLKHETFLDIEPVSSKGGGQFENGTNTS